MLRTTRTSPAKRRLCGLSTLVLAGAVALSACPTNLLAQSDPILDALQQIHDQMANSQGYAREEVIEWREIDGTYNNEDNPLWGSAGIDLLRLTTPEYGDGYHTPAGENRPSTRISSNHLCRQARSVFSERCASDFVWQWGQFIDHDMGETPVHNPQEHPEEIFNIIIPRWDPYFDTNGTGEVRMQFVRSIFAPSPVDPFVRQQINAITSYIDGSQVYGSDEHRANGLRRLDGTGKLLTSTHQVGQLLPFNYMDTNGEYFENAMADPTADPSQFFLAGDVRSNEQVGLSVMHTLFVLEHNRLADALHALFPWMTGEEIYQTARHIVGAEIEAITYNEWLPMLLGSHGLDEYAGYDDGVNATLRNFFTHSAFRVGHTMLSPKLSRLGSNWRPIQQGNLPLELAFFAPDELTGIGMEPYLRGLASQQMQRIDTLVVDALRNFLFQDQPFFIGFDLPALNMQRGRDHGLPDYNQARVDYGLDRKTSFDEITTDAAIQAQLEAVYGNIDNIDPWVGGLAENHLTGALVGELIQTVLVEQFTALRDGDRFWYQHYFTGPMLLGLEDVRLSDIIRANFPNIGTQLQNNVFRVRICAIDDVIKDVEITETSASN